MSAHSSIIWPLLIIHFLIRPEQSTSRLSPLNFFEPEVIFAICSVYLVTLLLPVMASKKLLFIRHPPSKPGTAIGPSVLRSNILCKIFGNPGPFKQGFIIAYGHQPWRIFILWVKQGFFVCMIPIWKKGHDSEKTMRLCSTYFRK